MNVPPQPMHACGAALLPAPGLDLLAPLRARGGIQIIVQGSLAWVSWDGSRPDVIEALLPAPGCEFFELRNGFWYAPGQNLPRFDVPLSGTPMAIDRAIVPAPFEPIEPQARSASRVPLQLVRSDRQHATSALHCPVADLAEWAESAPGAEIERVRGVHYQGIAWLRGTTLPYFPNAQRYWGERVLIPLGYRPDPDWSEEAIREAASIREGEILIIDLDGIQAIPESVFKPLTRAGIRKVLVAKTE